MNKLNIAAILTVICFSFSIGALAKNISNSEYKAARKNIVAGYKPAAANCGSFADNARSICLAEAGGKGNASRAELEAPGKPPKRTGHAASVARAESDYTAAKAKCDDMTGAVRNICVKEAKAALLRAKSDARAQMKNSKDSSTAVDESFEELMEMSYGN